jgi:hypothetical protein
LAFSNGRRGREQARFGFQDRLSFSPASLREDLTDHLKLWQNKLVLLALKTEEQTRNRTQLWLNLEKKSRRGQGPGESLKDLSERVFQAISLGSFGQSDRLNPLSAKLERCLTFRLVLVSGQNFSLPGFRSGDRLSPSSAPLGGALTDHLRPENLGLKD